MFHYKFTIYIVGFLFSSAIFLLAEIPNTLNYQGLLSDSQGQPVADELYSLTVRIYKVPSGGTPLYSEIIKNVQTTNGYFNLLIGKTTPIDLPFDETYWLGITVENGNEYLPRNELTSVPFSQNSKSAAKAKIADGLTNSAIGVVRSINGAEGTLILEGGGGTTINRNGQKITISSSGSSGTGMQGVQNTDNNLTIENPNGPVATINISNSFSLPPSGIAGGDLSGTYPNPSIADSKITNTKLADGAITNSKINDVSWGKITGAPSSFPPSGIAGGDLNGTYPNPLIGDGKITTDKIADSATTNSKIKSIDWTKITNAPTLGAKSIDELSDGKTDTTSVFLGLNSGNSDDGINYNTGVGIYSLSSNTSGNQNTAFGSSTLRTNTTGYQNTANGSSALRTNTTGYQNTSNGYYALRTNSSGNRNTANGASTLTDNTTGSLNTANGAFALSNNISGSGNSSFGAYALYNNTTGNQNIAIGNNSLYSNILGWSNVSVGVSSLYKNSSKANLVAIGDSSLFNNGTNASAVDHSINNTAVGSKALFANTTGSWNTSTGYNSMKNNTTGGANSSFGSLSMYSNTIGVSNSAFGTDALNQNTTASYNSAFGNRALFSNTTGSWNTAMGYSSLATNTTGAGNAAFGINSLMRNAIGSENSSFGCDALPNNSSGSGITALGYRSLYNNSTGSKNIAIGDSAGVNQTTGSNNIYIGNKGSAGESNLLKIGDTQTACEIKPVFAFTTNLGANVAINIVPPYTLMRSTSSARYKVHIRDIEVKTENIYNLRPVSYQSKTDGNEYFGLIAEEVAKTLPELAQFARAKDVIPGSSSEELIPDAVQYPMLSVLLLNEIKKQKNIIDLQTIELKELRKMILEIKEQIEMAKK